MEKGKAYRIARLAFPWWKGRKLSVEETETVRVEGTAWDGGTKREFIAVEINTGRVANQLPGLETPKEFGGLAGQYTMVIPIGVAIVEHSYFCGKDVGCRLHVRPAEKLEPANFKSVLNAEYEVL